MLKLEAKVQRVEIVHSGPELVAIYAQLRADCDAAGHALGQKAHTADRWNAAAAIRLAFLLISNDGIFRDAPGLEALDAGVGLTRVRGRFLMYPSGTRETGMSE